MSQIIAQEVAYLRTLRSRWALRDLEPGGLPVEKGLILVSCGDGNQLHDIFTQLIQFTRRIHLLAANGGAMTLGARFSGPTHLYPREAILAQIHEAARFKYISSLGPLPHYPCGVGRNPHPSSETT